MTTYTFKTSRVRVQLSITDFSGEHAKYAGEQAGKIFYSVGVLPSSAHPATSYSNRHVYHGECLPLALLKIQDATGIPPREARRELLKVKRMFKYLR